MENKTVKYKTVVPAEESGCLPGKTGSYNWCGFCGSVGNIEQSRYENNLGSMHSFCKGTECRKKYLAHIDSYHFICTNLTYGIAFRCIMKKNDNGDLVVPVVEDNQEDLTCAYCGKCDSNVIANACMQKFFKYGGELYNFKHNTFCKNDKCCLRYIEYTEDIARRRSDVVPHVYKSKCQCQLPVCLI
jgi:hypothetical protein